MNLPIAPLVALVLGAAAATAAAVMPVPMLEGLVSDSGLPAILSAAEPPLGATARLAVAAGAGGAAALVTWFALFILLGTRRLTVGRQPSSEAVPVLRRADAHPDAPARAPLLATRDLGTPFLEVTARPEPPKAEEKPREPLFSPVHVVAEPVEQELPVDLDQPLAAFDPGAIPDVPMPPPVHLRPLRRAPRPAVFDAGERFETFELTPIRRTAAPRPAPAPRDEAITRPETEATVHALLERLERGVVRRGLAPGMVHSPRPRDSERGLEDALVTLRNLARRA